jgi:hypothetical protein
MESFLPLGISTDSQGHILIADYNRDCVHVIDQNGKFLRHIRDLRGPHGLCVDVRNNLFVAERDTGKVKKIRYLYTNRTYSQTKLNGTRGTKNEHNKCIKFHRLIFEQTNATCIASPFTIYSKNKIS